MKYLRFLFRFFVSLLIAILLVVAGLLLTGNGYLVKAVQSTYLIGKTGPSIEDYLKFENRSVQTSRYRPWPENKSFNQYPLSEKEDSILRKWETVSFVVIQHNSLLFEKYWDNVSEDSYTNSFSVAKSLVGMAIGAAIKDGCIRSTDQRVSDFLIEFKTDEKKDIRLKDLLHMSSGIDFGESYGDPFGFMAKTYYGDELKDLTLSKGVKYPPGQVWKYQGGNTLLLSFILKAACGKNLSDFFSETIWSKIGASKEALWTINEEGEEKAYCCFYSNAKDFARIGQLMLDGGKFNGTQLIDSSYCEEMLKAVHIPDESGKTIDYYASHWWLTNYKGIEVFYARGILGQYIAVIPKWDAVFVRLGNKRDPNVGAEVPIDFIDYLTICEKMVSKH